MPNKKIRTEIVLDLLEDATSLDVVREFLRKKDLAHTAGSWQMMREKRLQPYLDDYKVTLDELIALLGAVEECGDQHIFLFQCNPAEVAAMFDRARTDATLRNLGLDDIILGPDIERKPPTPTIVEVRHEGNPVLSLTIKEAEVRKRHVLKKEKPRGKMIVKYFVEQEARAVNIAKLHHDGLLEFRIQSRDNTSRYDGDLNRFIRQVRDFFPIQKFAEVSVSRAKSSMWARRAQLGDLLRYTNASVVDEDGNKIQAATGPDGGDLSNSAAGRSVDFVLGQDAKAYCTDSNLWFVKSKHLTTSVHVLLNGAMNEFAVPRKCSAEDYDYVLRQIRHFNR